MSEEIQCPRCGDKDVFIEKLEDGSSKISCPACHWFEEFGPEKVVGEEEVERIQKGVTSEGDFYQYRWVRDKL